MAIQIHSKGSNTHGDGIYKTQDDGCVKVRKKGKMGLQRDTCINRISKYICNVLSLKKKIWRKYDKY